MHSANETDRVDVGQARKDVLAREPLGRYSKSTLFLRPIFVCGEFILRERDLDGSTGPEVGRDTGLFMQFVKKVRVKP
jgi:hypothetical protein